MVPDRGAAAALSARSGTGYSDRPRSSGSGEVSASEAGLQLEYFASEYRYSERCNKAWRIGWLEIVKIPPNGLSISKMTKITDAIETPASAIVT